MNAPPAAMPAVLAGLSEVADRFDDVLLDQYGVLHEGRAVYPAARDCVARLRAAGKRVMVISNSGKRAAENLKRLAMLGLPAEQYDGAMTSGEVAWQGLRRRDAALFAALGDRCFLISRGRDRSVVDGLGLDLVGDVDEADFILLGGLDDAASEPRQWEAEFRRAVERHVPVLCANPDLTMFGAQGLIPGPGALAQFYESLGGGVSYIGKPHPEIFAASLRVLGNPVPSRVLIVGDSVHHDIPGGRAAGLLTLLITGGVHKAALARANDLPAAVRGLGRSDHQIPHWAMPELKW